MHELPEAKEYILKKIKKNLKKYPDGELCVRLAKKFETQDPDNILLAMSALSPSEFLDYCIECEYIFLNENDDIHVCKTQNELDSYLLHMSNDKTEITFSMIDDQ